MKEKHVRLELAQGSATMRAVGWQLAARTAEIELGEGSVIDVAYRIRENEHPEYGGIEIEIVGMETAKASI
jgi:single-stranded-DNA-specific exonuclease